MARLAPASFRRCAMAQAMLRLFANPQTTALRPCRLIINTVLSTETEKNNRNQLLAFSPGRFICSAHDQQAFKSTIKNHKSKILSVSVAGVFPTGLSFMLLRCYKILSAFGAHPVRGKGCAHPLKAILKVRTFFQPDSCGLQAM